jgi:hypothetical protein
MSQFGDPFLQSAPGWTQVPVETRWPSANAQTTTYDVSEYRNVGGAIGLNPEGPVSHGTVTFRWTSDAAGTRQVGVQGIPLTSLIVSNYQLNIPNLGPYLHVEYKPYVGPNPITLNLSGTNVDRTLPGDTILIEDTDRVVGAQATYTVYPCDYFAGTVGLYFEAVRTEMIGGLPALVPVPDARATFYAVNLTDDNRKMLAMGPGRATAITPMGTWFCVIWNPLTVPITYTLAAVPLLT